MHTYKTVLDLYSFDSERAWNQDTQISLLLSFLQEGGGSVNDFILFLNNFIDEERSVCEEELGNDYPLTAEQK